MSQEQDFDFNSVFLPARALRLDQRDHFVGRGKAIIEALAQLSTTGTSLGIIGERGIGKTSLGERIKEYVSGDTSWVNQTMGTVGFSFPECDVAWLEISKYHVDFFGVIIDLVTNRGKAKRWNEFSIGEELYRISREEEVGKQLAALIEPEKLRIFQENLSKGGDPVTQDTAMVGLVEGRQREILQLFRSLVSKISQARKRPLIIFLDEFDRLRSKEGLGEFLKIGSDSTDGLGCQFVVIGIADDVEQIGVDHQSSERKVMPILVERFSKVEVAAFIADLNRRLGGTGMRFNEEFTGHCADFSDGFPSLCQRLALNAAISKMQDVRVRRISDATAATEVEIGADDFFSALDGIINPNLDRGGRYRKLRESVNNSNKEALLFALSDFKKGWVSYEELRNSLASNYRFIQSIDQLDDSEVIVKHNGYVRFFDPQLRAIVKVIRQREGQLYIA